MPVFVVAQVLAVLCGGAWCLGAAALRRRSPLGRRSLGSVLAFSAIVAGAAWLRFGLVPAHHAMYLDEPWYAEAACNYSRTGSLSLCEESWSGVSCEPYEKAVGWPVVISLWTTVAGCGSSAGIAINRVLGTATVPVVALAAAAAGASAWQAAVAAAILAMHPPHIDWSATGETNVAAALAILLGICGALAWLRDQSPAAVLLTAAALSLATAIRPESLFAALVIAAVLASTTPILFRQRVIMVASIVAPCAASGLAGAPLWMMNESISGGGFLSISNIAPNLLTLGRAGSLQIHGTVALLGICGVLALRRRRSRATALLLSAATTSAALAVLAYERFADRMLLGATASLLPACGLALDWLSARRRAAHRQIWIQWLGGAITIAILAVVWRDALGALSVPSETQLLETRIVDAIAVHSLPGDALIVAEQPTVLAAAGLPAAMNTAAALTDERRLDDVVASRRPVFFLRDMYCETGFAGGAAAARCSRLLERFQTSTVLEQRLHSRSYALYRLSLPE